MSLMTLYIIKETNPDLVQKFDNVVALEVDKEAEVVRLVRIDFIKNEIVHTNEYKVISIESN